MPNRFDEPIRARRIRERARMQARGYRVAKLHFREPSGSDFPWMDAAHREHAGLKTWDDLLAFRRLWAIIQADNLAVCSCHMCGNPRRAWGEKTRQELRAEMAARSQLEDAGIAGAKEDHVQAQSTNFLDNVPDSDIVS